MQSVLLTPASSSKSMSMHGSDPKTIDVNRAQSSGLQEEQKATFSTVLESADTDAQAEIAKGQVVSTDPEQALPDKTVDGLLAEPSAEVDLASESEALEVKSTPAIEYVPSVEPRDTREGFGKRADSEASVASKGEQLPGSAQPLKATEAPIFAQAEPKPLHYSPPLTVATTQPVTEATIATSHPRTPAQVAPEGLERGIGTPSNSVQLPHQSNRTAARALASLTQDASKETPGTASQAQKSPTEPSGLLANARWANRTAEDVGEQLPTASRAASEAETSQSKVAVPPLVEKSTLVFQPLTSRATSALREEVHLDARSREPEVPSGSQTAVTKALAQTTMKPSIVQSMVVAGWLEPNAVSGDTSSRLVGDAVEQISWDLRGASASSTAANPVHVAPRADLPPHIAQQVAAALQRAPDKPIEIALNPPELGRVRMVMSASEAGVVVQVLAERSDTLDLMRRNIDELGRALSDLGYAEISFAFGQGSYEAEQDDAQATGDDALRLDVEDPGADDRLVTTQLPNLAVAPDGIDIRL